MPPRRQRPFDIETAFRDLEAQFLASSRLFDAIAHTGVQGGEREEIIREFLRDHLPSRFGVTRGEIRDKNNRRSREFDALIFDRAILWKLYRYKLAEVLPIEAVYATIEVKKKLTRAEVAKICDASFHLGGLEFEPSGRRVPEIDTYGNESVTSLSYVTPFAVAFDGPDDWRRLWNWFAEWWRGKRLSSEEVVGIIPHCLCVIGKYSLIAGVAGPTHRPGFVRNRQGEVPLLSFYLSLFQGINGIRLAEFNLLEYEDIRKYFDSFISTDSLVGKSR